MDEPRSTAADARRECPAYETQPRASVPHDLSEATSVERTPSLRPPPEYREREKPSHSTHIFSYLHNQIGCGKTFFTLGWKSTGFWGWRRGTQGASSITLVSACWKRERRWDLSMLAVAAFSSASTAGLL